jgi:hypothetical protein
MKCKFCGNDKRLIKAHIIPEGFFRRQRQGQELLELVTNKAGEYSKKAPIGIYDKTIVCKECENIWREWDDYAQKLLAEEPLNGQARYHGCQKIAYMVKDFDYKKLKLFFISMIWRASVSSHPFFSRISLGSFERDAKDFVANSNPGSSEDFSVTLSKFCLPLGKQSTMDPYQYKNLGVNYYRFYLAGYIADIKVDHKPTPMPLSQITISENKPLYILCRDFRKSKELNLMKQLITQSK